MKWKIGAVLMAIVFFLAIVPTVISGVSAGGFTDIFSSAQQLVVEVGNNNAMLSGQKISFGDDIQNAVYADETGEIMLPISGTAQAMGMELSWDGSAPNAKLTKDDKTFDVNIVYPQTNDINAPVFMSAKNFADGMGWTYKVSENGYFAVLSDKETNDKTMSKLCDKATEQIGIPKDMLVKSSLIFRAGSDKVIKNGEEVTLEDSDGLTTYTPIVDGDNYYLPVNGLATAFGGTSSEKDGKTTISIGDKSIEITENSDNVIVKEDIMYISAKTIAEKMDYTTAGTGDIFMMGELSYGNADSQVSALTAMGEQLPDQAPPIPKADAYVALTFDDGPTGGSEGLTARLLNGLKERNAHATFFMCGYRIKDFHTHMDRYLAEGHELGNHTMDHPGLLTKKTYDVIVEQIQSNSDLINSYCGEGPTVFRPVGGDVNDDVKKAAKACGLPIINWSVDTLDWRYRDAERIKNVIVENAKDGDIVLMHDLRDCTLEGVLNAIDILSEKGYAFVTVEELARIKGVEMKAGEVYTNFRNSTVQKLLTSET